MVFNFLWHNKLPKVKRQTIIAELYDGNLRMPIMFVFHNAQKAVWIKCYLLNSTGKWENTFLPNNLNEILHKYVFLKTFIKIGHCSIQPSYLGLRCSEYQMNLKIKDLLNNKGKLMSPKI